MASNSPTIRSRVAFLYPSRSNRSTKGAFGCARKNPARSSSAVIWASSSLMSSTVRRNASMALSVSDTFFSRNGIVCFILQARPCPTAI
jgi:hypothetical protein